MQRQGKSCPYWVSEDEDYLEVTLHDAKTLKDGMLVPVLVVYRDPSVGDNGLSGHPCYVALR